MKNSADQGGSLLSALVDNTLQDLQNSSYPTKAEFNNCFIIFIQNNSKFKNNLKHANLGPCKFISIMHISSLASLGDKGLFRSANNILQITDAVRPYAVLAMFLNNILP